MVSRLFKFSKVVLWIGLLWIMTWPLVNTRAANINAEIDSVTWSEPIELSNPNIQSWSPTIAADLAGNLHVMWSQTMSKEPIFSEGDTLYYTRWDGKNWTPAIDVLVSLDGGAEFPEITVTPDGILHAVWGTGGNNSKLMYARAPACCANTPKNWSHPINLGGPVNLTTAITSDDKGNLHAAFASLETGNIVYLRSTDGGNTWPVWVNIDSIVSSKDDSPGYPRLAVDKLGRVHMVWSVGPWPGRYVMYSRSDDGGINWSIPRIIDRYDSGSYENGYGPIFIDIETYGEDEIHLIWDGAPTVERNHIWSSDGGNTWSKPSLVFPISGVGRSGWNDMVFDSDATAYAVALGQPWIASWSENTWSEATDIGNADGKAEWVRIAATRGNQLHVVWSLKKGEGTINSVWYVMGKTSAPPLSTHQLPNLLPTPTAADVISIKTPATTESVIPIVHNTPIPWNYQSNNSIISFISNPLSVILISVIATLSIFGIVFGVRFWWSIRR